LRWGRTLSVTSHPPRLKLTRWTTHLKQFRKTQENFSLEKNQLGQRTNHSVQTRNKRKQADQKEESSKLPLFLSAQPTGKEQQLSPLRRRKSSETKRRKRERKKLHVESLGRLAEAERRAREAQLAPGTTCDSLRGDNYSHFFYRLVEEVRVELLL